MTAITNTFQTYQAKGIRESLSDIVEKVEMEETPFSSNIGTESATNTFEEWQTQALASADTANAHIEGDDTTTYDAVTPTVRIGNYLQIMKRKFLISETEEKVKKAGRKSEIAYQKVLKGLELRRDQESIFLMNQGASAGSSSTARKLGSLLAFIKTNTSIGAGGVNPVYTNIPTDVRTDGTQRAFTEAIHKNVLQQMYSSGAKTDMLMVGPVNKQRVSGFAGIAQLRTETNKKVATIVGAADVYVGDFGPVSVVPNAFQRERDALYIDTNQVSKMVLRPYQAVERAQTGDARKFECLQEVTLMVKSERGLGIAADLTTT